MVCKFGDPRVNNKREIKVNSTLWHRALLDVCT